MDLGVTIPNTQYWKDQIKCQAACPLNTDARGYVRAIADGDDELAYLIARGPNPLASICGRVCGALCEEACRRGDYDQSISIRALKRYVCDQFGPESRPDGGKSLILSGSGASEEGDRPFLDRFDLKTKKAERLWRSEAPYYERAVTPADSTGRNFLMRRESKDEPPNYFVRDVKKDKLRQLTDFPHPTPQLEGLQKEMIRYERADGVKMTATLYLPPGHTKETALVSTSNPASRRETSLATIRSQPLRTSLRCAAGITSSLSAANPITTRSPG